MAAEHHIESLRQKHALLESRIQSELARPYHDSMAVRNLKFEKLHVKEQLDRYTRN
ncbi:MAG TPA: DUF465 domain-containing protein [Azospirillaceae bacterium]|nr:DUF465 domain-containing protein [Azospirillaceae bacterium]